jgi:general secretion pathway protein K
MLLALLATNAIKNSRTSVNLSRNLLISAQAEAAADAGMHLAILALLDPDGNGIVPEDGTPFEIPISGGTVVLSVQDEAGLLNLNHASTEELRMLMVAIGIAPVQAAELADAIVLVRSPGSRHRAVPTAETGNAVVGALADAKSGFFEILEELQQVHGMTPALYRHIAPYLTADSHPSRLDPDVAPPEVLLAVTGLDQADLRRIVAEEARPMRETPLEGTAEFGGQGYRRAPQDRSSAVRGLLAPSQREVFIIRAQASTPGGGLFVREARVYCSRDPESPFRILGWGTGRPFLPTSVQ